MIEPIVHELALVRRACRQLKARADPATADALSAIIDVLDRLVADQHGGLFSENAAELTSYKERAEALRERLRACEGSAQWEGNLLLNALESDGAYWQASEDRVMQELSDSRDFALVAVEESAQLFDHTALERFLNERLEGEGSLRVVHSTIASEGTSKKTLFVSLTGNRRLPNEVVLRMDKAFNFLGTTVRDEFAALRLLHTHGAPVPHPYVLESIGNVLGNPFIIGERLRGSNNGKSYFPPPRSDALTTSIARSLARIHAVPLDDRVQIGAPRGDPRPYIEYEIDRYYGTWLATEAICPVVDAAFLWIKANTAKAHGALCIVHNDFDYHNIIVDRDEVSGVVDWEFVHVGNPAADLGYFQDSADQTTGFEFFLEQYEREGGRRPSKAELDFYIVWGHVRLAVMSFQVEMACRQGKFDDIRYALAGVHFLRKPILATVAHLSRILKCAP